MKKKTLLWFCLGLFTVSAITSGCSKDNDKEQGQSQDTFINAKWVITDSNSPYASFEFTKDGNYIVVENSGTLRSTNVNSKSSQIQTEDIGNISFIPQHNALRASTASEPEVYFGTYQIKDKTTIILSGFGTLFILTITADELEFSFASAANPSKKTEYSATKASDTVAASTQTDKLCRTWRLVKLMGVEIEKDSPYGTTILISRAGTYFTEYANGIKELSQWKWYDYPGLGKETVFVYSHNNWASMGAAFIETLTNEVLKITDSTGTEYELVPVRN